MLPMIHRAEDVAALTRELGFLPLLDCGIPGFSVAALTDPSIWEERGDGNPWEWRYLLAEREDIAYGKLFKNKIGFVSRDWVPRFTNIRRNGYDFDAMYADGGATWEAAQLMALFSGGTALPSWDIKRLGPANAGEKHLTELQMRGYLVICGFEQKKNRSGAGYGWPCGVYCTPEAKFGADYVRSGCKESPAESMDKAILHLRKFLPHASGKRLIQLLKG